MVELSSNAEHHAFDPARNQLQRDRLETKAKGHFDPRGGQSAGVANRSFDDIRAALMRRTMEAVEHQRHILNTLKLATWVRNTVYLIDEKLYEANWGFPPPARGQLEERST